MLVDLLPSNHKIESVIEWVDVSHNTHDAELLWESITFTKDGTEFDAFDASSLMFESRVSAITCDSNVGKDCSFLH